MAGSVGRSVLFILFLVSSIGAQQPNTGTVRGIVVDWTTGLPIAEATVTILQERMNVLVRRTDQYGRFVFQSLPFGNHVLRVNANGYSLKDGLPSAVGSEYRVLEIGAYGTVDVRVEMVPGGTITGTVWDKNDRPVPGLRITALEKQFNTNGDFVLTSSNIRAVTDNQGQYALTGLRPGEHFIKVESDPPIYYPATSDPRDATAVFLTATLTTAFGIDFRLSGEGLVQIRGYVVNADNPEADEPLDVLYLVPAGAEGGVDIRTADKAARNRTRSFEMRNVAPGTYDVGASFESNGRRYFGRTRVDVHFQDIENLRVTAYPAVHLAGRVLTQTRATGIDVTRMRVGFIPKIGRGPGLGSSPAVVNPRGEIVFQPLLPDEYRLSISGLPAGFYVESARLDGVDVFERWIPVMPNSSTVEVTIAGPAVTVQGRVVTEQGPPPVEPAMIILIPTQPPGDDPTLSIKMTMSSLRGGDFTFPDVAPGLYRLIAFQNVLNGFPFYNADFLQRYLGRATLVTVEGTNPIMVKTVAVPILP
jgi:hypothetical protein